MMTNIRPNLDNLQLPDIYSLMLFLMYKIQDIPEYATLSKLCYLVDGNSLQRVLTYFAGQTIKFPTESDFTIMTSALLLYQYVNIERMAYADAQAKLENLTAKQREKVTDLYLSLIPLVEKYPLDKGPTANGK